MSRVWLRAALLLGAVIAAVVGLTVYLSTEEVPPCLVGGAPRWRPPADDGVHRYEVVFLDHSACFFAIGESQQLVGALDVSNVQGISAAAPLGDEIGLRTSEGPFTLDLRRGRARAGGVAPFSSDTVTVMDPEHDVMYVTRRGELGFLVIDMVNRVIRFGMKFKGFTWNPRFGPDPPSHGLSLAPDRPELWVLDAPNSAVHVFDVSELPVQQPRPVETIRLSKPLSGDERACTQRCRRLGWLQHSSDGRYVYVGDSGDVIDTQTRKRVANLEALRNSRVMLEVAWVDGRPEFPRVRR